MRSPSLRCFATAYTLRTLQVGVLELKIVTRVLDGTFGMPAVGVRARLACGSSDLWKTVAEAETNSEGCIEDWDSWKLERGLYRIMFDSDSYFSELGAATAYPEIIVIFRMLDESHKFQVQVTLSPYSYSTYFGTTQNQVGNHVERAARGDT